MITEQEYRNLKLEVEEAKAKSQQAKGALEQLMRRLETEYECNSLDEAEELLKRLQKEKEEKETEFDRLMRNYQKKWKSND